MELEVGIRLSGSASFSTLASITTSAALAIGESRFPTIAMIGDLNLRKSGIRRITSVVLPLLERTTVGSPGW